MQSNTAQLAELEYFASLALVISGCSSAFASLVEDGSIVMTASAGGAIDGIGEGDSLLTLARGETGLLVITDPSRDARTSGHPMVRHGGVRFYAGIGSGSGRVCVVLCMVDARGRTLSAEQVRLLEMLANQIREATDLQASLTRLERNIAEAAYSVAEKTQAQERLQLALASAMLCILEWDTSTRTLRYSDKGGDIFGTADVDWEQSLDGLSSHVHEDDRARFQQAFERAAATGESSAFEFRLLWPDGPIHWIYVNVDAYYGGRPSPTHVMGVCVDISARKSIEASLQFSETRFYAFMDNSPVIAYVTDRDGRFVYANRGVQQLGGQAAYQGKTSVDVIGGEAGDVMHANTLTALKRNVVIEFPVRGIGGPERELQQFAFPFDDADRGRFVGCLAFDVTDQRHLEREQAAHVYQLEEARLLADIQASQLEQQSAELTVARDQAVASARTKSEFLANMSHEIRTPMNGIIGMADLIQGTSLNAQQQTFVHTIQHSAHVLLAVINDILDFSKIEAGKLAIENIPFDLREVLQEVTDLLSVKGREKGIDVRWEMAPDCPSFLIGDNIRIRQVLTNLMGNAVKFTEQGEVSVGASVVQETGAEATIRIDVRDTGIGIDPGHQAQIFESFTQADGSITRRYGGTGLGLTICRQLVSLMGGEIGVTSVVGEGSIFSVTLPFNKDTEASDVPALRVLDDIRVLILDRRADARDIVGERLQSWGCRTETTSDAFDVLECLATAAATNDHFTIALLDAQTVMSQGAALATRIALNAQRDGVGLLLTGADEPPEGLRPIEFADIVAKPMHALNLFRAVSRWANGQRGIEVEASEAKPTLTGMRILLAEDNEINRQVAIHTLDLWGCIVDTVETGKAALDAIEQQSYDAVLMDVQMPELGGLDATAILREREKGTERHQVVIAMTAHNMSGDRERCLAAGMDEYTSKPLTKDKLFAALKQWWRPEEPTPPRSSAPLPKREGEEFSESAASTVPFAFRSVSVDDGNSSTRSEAKVLDLEALGRNCNENASLKERIVDTFILLFPETLERVRAAVRESNVKSVRIEAHTLKGSCCAVGADAMTSACVQLEMAALDNDLRDAPEFVERIAYEYERLRPALEQVRSTLAPEAKL